MTLAAFLIILFFLPGFIFNLAYYNAESIPLNTSLTHRAIVSLVFTAILHGLALVILVHCFDKTFNLNLFLMLLSGTQNIINSIPNNAIEFTISYLLCLYVIAYIIGAFLRWIIKKFGLDHYAIFKVDNPWYYLFKGDEQADGVKIAATVEIAGDSFLYIGVLDDFFINKEGNLDRLVLAYASRRELKNDKGSMKESERFYPIDGNYFILKYNEIKNLNVEYFNAFQDKDTITVHYVTPKE